MLPTYVHMRDQKANQSAMRSRQFRQMAINRLEELTVVIILWSVYLLTGAS